MILEYLIINSRRTLRDIRISERVDLDEYESFIRGVINTILYFDFVSSVAVKHYIEGFRCRFKSYLERKGR